MLSFCHRKSCLNIPFKQSRKRGRPRLTAPALEFQEKEYVYSDTDTEDKEEKKQKKSNQEKKSNRN